MHRRTQTSKCLRVVLGAVVIAAAFIPGVYAQTEVYSNIVGYQRVSVPSEGYALVATPFDPGTNASVQEVIGPQMTGEIGSLDGDEILFWDAQVGDFVTIWRFTFEGSAFDGKWLNDTSTAAATNEIQIGQGFWIHNRHLSNQTVVVVGDIVTDDAVTNTIAPGFQLLSNPFSADISLNSAGLTNGVATTDFDSADNILLFDEATQEYKELWLLSNPAAPQFDRKWIDGGQIATNVLVTGEGFWYESKNPSNSFEWVISRPYTLP